MLDAEWSVEAVAEVALVEVSVHNPTAVDRRVSVENRLDGPTLPPRSEGVPEQGWDADGYAGVVPAGETIRLGFASPATPVEPPVAVEDEGRSDGQDAPAGADATGEGSTADGADAAAAVRLLGDGAPPADALSAADPETRAGIAADAGPSDGARVSAATDADVTASVGGPVSTSDADGGPAVGADGELAPATDGRCVPSTAEGGPATNGTADGVAGADPDASGVPADRGDGAAETDAPGGADGAGLGTDGADAHMTDGVAVTGVDDVGAAGADAGGGDASDGPARGADEPLPAPAEAWLSDVTDRVEHGERLTGASVVEAAAVLDERGGFAAVEGLPDRLAADEAALRALADRATALADRAAATDVPLAALRRLS